MATVVTTVSGGTESGTSASASGLSYQPGDFLIAFITSTAFLNSFSDSTSLGWTVGLRNSNTIQGSSFYRSVTNTATSTNVTATMSSSGACSFIVFRVRPDPGKAIVGRSWVRTNSSATTPSVTIPGTITTSSVLFGAQCVNDDVFFTDTDTTGGAWSSVFSLTSSGVDRAVAAQWKIPNSTVAQTYNGTYASSELAVIIGVNLEEVDLGFWGVRA